MFAVIQQYIKQNEVILCFWTECEHGTIIVASYITCCLRTGELIT